jgi:hexosaminidase
MYNGGVPTIIPLPERIEGRPGEFSLTSGTGIHSDPPNRTNALYLQRLLAASTGFALPVRTLEDVGPQGGAIRLQLDPARESLGAEGYRLEVRPEGVCIEALQTAGVFHGIQSLRQLLAPEIESRKPIPAAAWRAACLEIHDRPRFGWRGFMLDEGRHFHGKETVQELLELMALLKLNVFHWHLTEDQGWRIQIGKYPRLTEVGSQRPGTSRSLFSRGHDRRPHGGFYTQEEIREVAAFAAERHITIVPELEMPGHSRAALAAHPELSCMGGPFAVATRFGIFADILCPGKESTFAFLEDVLDELAALFPGPYLHIGGDEAPLRHWRACPNCQGRIRNEGLTDEHALQVYLTNRIAAHLRSGGRRAVAWNQVLGPGLAEDVIVQYWIGDRKALMGAVRNDGRRAVMSGFLEAYLDHAYALTPLSRAYRYEPVPGDLSEAELSRILGLEFPLWTEWVPSRERLDYQVWPRLAAAAETGWTPAGQKDLAGFRPRLEGFLARLDRLGVRYAPLAEAEPSRLKRWFGPLTILQPQRRTRR